MANFTPGPWIIDPVRAGDKEIYITQPGDTWERLEATVSRDDCDSDMALANAHLIAAAPELYEAALSVVNSSDYDEGQPLIRNLKAAIAKADGSK